MCKIVWNEESDTRSYQLPNCAPRRGRKSGGTKNIKLKKDRKKGKYKHGDDPLVADRAICLSRTF